LQKRFEPNLSQGIIGAKVPKHADPPHPIRLRAGS
jgi:hypothetical protein